MILYLSLYVLGQSLSTVYIGKCVGSFKMCRGGFGYPRGVGGRGCVLCSCGLVCMLWFVCDIHFLRCLV